MSIDEHRILLGRILLKPTTKNSSRAQTGRNVVKQSVVIQCQRRLLNTIVSKWAFSRLLVPPNQRII